ncbi:MAG TPA: DUF4214 domain-containing protein [Pirellulales bacterium]|nr:DUF4214 domain-containing protein [Pirellulales bacterium]
MVSARRRRAARLRLEARLSRAAVELLEPRWALAALVHIAYLIPENRTAQPDAVATLQADVLIWQHFYGVQMAANGFGPKTFHFETAADGVTPVVHVVNLPNDDAFYRADDMRNNPDELYSRVSKGAQDAGLSIWAPNTDWLLICESHRELSDGSILGGSGISLGASNGSGSDGGVAVLGSDMLPFLRPDRLTDNEPYAGLVIPEIGPYPLVSHVSHPSYEGDTVSSVASSYLGAGLHELSHGFGLSHDYLNDDNFFGNLMYNGLRGFRGSVRPDLYPNDATRSGYAESLVLNTSRYFNPNMVVTSDTPPALSVAGGGPQIVGGLLQIPFTVDDPLGLSSAILLLDGNVVGDMPLTGTHSSETFQTAYYTPGNDNLYTVEVYDAQGNRSNKELTLHPATGNDQAPQPFVKIVPPSPVIGQSVVLDASRSIDPGGAVSSLKVEWDLDGDGVFDTAPSSDLTLTTSFATAGPRLIRCRITDAQGNQTISEPIGIDVVVDAALSGTASPIAATEGAMFKGTVATFSDADPAGATGDYTATIDWGDKTALTTVTGSAFTSAGGVFSVPGSHVYAEDGNYTLVVTISDVGGASATVNPIATVGDAALSATAVPVTASEGTTFSGTVASVSDANPAGTTGDYTATITWDDGSKTSGTVSAAAGGGFVVGGSHVFAEDGSNLPVSVVVVDKGGSTVTITSTATVADAALSGTASPIAATEGASFSGTVATFSDANPAGAAGDYTATINWEDGSTTSGTVTTSTGGGFAVSGSHVFLEEGSSLPVSVVITDKGGAAITIVSNASVSDATLNGMAATIAAGITVSGTVASFSDADTADTTSDYTVSINWGDGQTSAGGVVAGAAGQFNVTGNHSYGDANPHTITVTVAHGTAQPLVIQSAEPGNPVPLSVVDDVYVIGAGTVTVAAANGVLANDSASSALTVTTGTVAGANGGTFAFNADGSFTYTPPANFPGFDYAQYSASDAQGDKGTATVNVLSQTGGVVWKFYESVLNRNPDYGGLKYWINDFANGGKTGDIAIGFFESNELLNKIIGGYYEQYLGRTLDAAGLSYWEGVWHATGGPEGIKAGFAASPEFNHNAGDTQTGWLTALYQRILNRVPDAQGFAYWQQQLAAGESESNVALGFFDSLEAYKNDVTGWFNEYLGRTPSGAELTQYASEMAAGKTDRTIEQEITNLPEYGANPPASPAGTAVRLPDYLPRTSAGSQQQAALAAKDALFSSLGG